jgi:hypothetical protein
MVTAICPARFQSRRCSFSKVFVETAIGLLVQLSISRRIQPVNRRYGFAARVGFAAVATPRG